MNKNVVVIMTDTTRKDMLGCYGNDKMITPNLDKLAEDGIKYENAFTCQPVCGPARSALFTGMYPNTNGVVANCISFSQNIKTIGERLTEEDIHCGYIGKWHLDGGDYFGNGQCPDGWDDNTWYDMRNYLEELSESDRRRSRIPSTSFDEDITKEFTFAHRCTNRAIDFINKNEGEDFFLVLSYDEPHDPSVCPSPYNKMYEGFKFDYNPNYDDDLSKKPYMQQLWSGKDINKSGEELNQPSEQLSLLLGCNSFVDSEIGRILETINEKIPNALVIFTSDHGDMLSNHKLKIKNATAYKEVANIPLIIRGGEVGKVIEYPASHIDIVPTVLDYFNKDIPKTLQGRSMLPQINDTSIKIRDNAFIEFTRYEVDHDGFGGLQMLRAITNERYKLVINLLDTDEFYDLEKDPYEVNNLINDPSYKEARDLVHDKLLEHMNESRDLYRGYQWAVRPWREDKLPLWQNAGYTRQRYPEKGECVQLDYDTGMPIDEYVRKKKTDYDKAE